MLNQTLEQGLIFGCTDKLLQFNNEIVIVETEKAFGSHKLWPELVDDHITGYLLDAAQAAKKDLDSFDTPEPLESMEIDPLGNLEVCLLRKLGCPEEGVMIWLCTYKAMSNASDNNEALDSTFGMGRKAFSAWMNGDLNNATLQTQEAIMKWQQQDKNNEHSI